jgi:hypothetical protein
MIDSSTKAKRVALYVRVSTANRATRNQAVFEQTPRYRNYPSVRWPNSGAGAWCGCIPIG